MKNKLSIKIRLLLLTLIIIVSGIAFMFLYYIFTNKVLEHTALMMDYSRLETNILSMRKAEKQFLSHDLDDLSFFQTEESQNIELIRHLSDENEIIISRLFNYNFISYNSDYNTRLNSVYKNSINYNTLINDLVLNVLQRGYKTYGIEGEFRKQEAFFSSLAFKEVNTTRGKNYLQLCSYSKDYLLNRDSKYLYELDKLITQIKNQIYYDNTIQTNLTRYSEFAGRLMEKDNIIGVNSDEGILGELNKQYYQLENELLDLRRTLTVEIADSIKSTHIIIALLLSIIILLLTIYSISIARNVNKPMLAIRKFMKDLIVGKLPFSLNINYNEETTEISRELEVFVNSLKDKTKFAREIGKGNLDAKYKPLSDEDVLGISLVELGNSLEEAKNEDRKYKTEEEKRTWTNEGLTRFGEILRLNNDNIEKLADEIIMNLVKYLKANQGGLFLLNDDDKENITLDLISAFAFDRKKYLTNKLKLGEGLVGACALEKETFVLTEVPEDYLYIKSGLGQANPRCILISPLKLEETVLGIVEIASFNEFQSHEVEFVEKIAESIASTLNNAKINARTAILLEQSKKQAVEMAEQEEQMRQNVEELQAVQEEASQKDVEINSIISAINASSLVVEFDMEGVLTAINDRYLQLIEAEEAEIIGMHHSDFIVADKELSSYKNFWKSLVAGKRKTKFENLAIKSSEKLLIKQTYCPIMDKEGNPYKVLCISMDITESKLQEETINKQAIELDRYKISLESLSSAVDKTLMRCDLNKDGKIVFANGNFNAFMRSSKDDLIGKNYKNFLNPDEKEEFEGIWKDVLDGKAYRGIIKRKNVNNITISLMTTLEPVKNELGNIIMVIMLSEETNK